MNAELTVAELLADADAGTATGMTNALWALRQMRAALAADPTLDPPALLHAAPEFWDDGAPDDWLAEVAAYARAHPTTPARPA